MNKIDQEIPVDDFSSKLIPTTPSHKSVPIEIEPGKTLNINPNLSSPQTKFLVQLLREHKDAFAWDYTDAKGIHLDLRTLHIYIK
jgi:hypothetical protein